ncbi:MAG TPA: hypothetical protein VGG82_02535 [Casimicrobiaceae bacterium]|jgi:hypothetical protein
MISRLFLVTSLAASLSVTAAGARAQAAPVTMPAIPPHNCVKPELPGRLASPSRVSVFNKEYTAYGECIKKYVDETKAMSNAAIAAANGAIDEFNKFSAELKAESDAAKN